MFGVVYTDIQKALDSGNGRNMKNVRKTKNSPEELLEITKCVYRRTSIMIRVQNYNPNQSMKEKGLDRAAFKAYFYS